MQGVSFNPLYTPTKLYSEQDENAAKPAGSFIPGSYSINILHAMTMALKKIRPYYKPAAISGEYLGQAKEKFKDLAPKVRQAIQAPLARSFPFNDSVLRRTIYETQQDKARRIKRELLDAGSTFYGLLKSETRVLPKLLHPHEHIEAVVYGQHRSHSVMLVATNERIIYVDKKPMALFLDEVSYEVVSGIQFEVHILFATLTLHTPVKNYDIKFANLHCAENFARHIEAQRLKRELLKEETEHELPIPRRPQVRVRNPIELKETMAGYYWLPAEEEDDEK